MPAIKALTAEVPKETLTSVRKKFEEFKQQVVDAVMDWGNDYDEPCGARIDFLESIGLTPPTRRGVFNVQVTYDVPGESSSAVDACDYVADKMERAFEKAKEDIAVGSVDIDYWDD